MNAEDRLFATHPETAAQGPVHCLGMQFPDDNARRAYFLDRLQEKLRDPAFRCTPGFPIGTDEDILNLSDPPYFTACPNPFLEDMVRHHGTAGTAADGYHCEPYAADVTAGKNDTIYMAHSYHTKVPHQAILRYLLHYTKPGDIVLDGFCGSGMTGVAAAMCADLPAADKQAIEQQMPDVQWGRRIAILNDLSPAATFITHNYNVDVDADRFEQDARELLQQIEEECGELYRTAHKSQSALLPDASRQSAGLINYCVWSEVMSCPQCAAEIVFYDHAIDSSSESLSVRSEFPCPDCGVQLTKRSLQSFFETVFDPLLNRNVQRIKYVPVSLKYLMDRKHFSRELDQQDLDRISAVQLAEHADVPSAFELPGGGLSDGNQTDGMTHLHHYYTPRNFLTISRMLAAAKGPYRLQLINLIQSISVRLCSFLTTYQLGKRGNVPMTGTLYVASLLAEANPIKSLEGKLRDFVRVYQTVHQRNFVGCGASSQLDSLPDNSVDYIFIDPPFGDNLNYSQLNMLWEGWLRLQTNIDCEAIVDRHTRRDLAFYQEMLRACLTEFHRVLKPGRWMTVEFHNSKNAVWNAIQAAIVEAGFLIADVRTLDKKQGTPKQVNSVNAVKQDLVISAYKPTEAFEQQFSLQAGTLEGIWSFVAGHLRQLPVFVSNGGRAESVAERQKHLLFDRMIAFHVQRGITIPISASAFYHGLQQRYPERDGMYFLPEQVPEYDRKRLDVTEVEQLELFVTDERSAIQWLRRLLSQTSLTFTEIQPLYLKETRLAWEKHESQLELRDLLEQSFVQDDTGAWRLPDATREEDLEQLRMRSLLKEFHGYLDSKGKLRQFRSEALRAGFKEAWQNGDYQTIIQLAERVPDTVIQEDAALLMYLDNALMRTGDGS